jgi:hypothetical protein
MSLDIFGVIKTGIDLAKALRDFRPKPEERDRHLRDDVSQALRTLYFTPKGILSLLKEVADGEKLSEERIQQFLNDFNDREWKVEAALHRVDFYALKRELGLSLASISVLEQLRYGKINLRRSVQAEVNPYGQDGTSPNKAKARRLIAAIEKLNAEIEDVEGIINGRAQSEPVRQKITSKQKSAAKKKAAPRKKAAARQKGPRMK